VPTATLLGVNTFTLVPQGAFSLQESVEFGFGQRHAEEYDGTMRLAFVLDDHTVQAGVELTQDHDGVHGRFTGTDDVDRVRRQVARILSLDHDGAGFDALGQRDPVLGRLLEAAPGLRPPLFHSPYEAALWSVLSARRSARQMAQVRDRMAETYGARFTLAGQRRFALPTPGRLLGVTDVPGIPEEKLARMHGVARAALAGQLDVERLLALGPVAAAADLQSLKGIGPFYASLIVIRAVGFTDVLPREEPRLRALVTDLYDMSVPCTAEQLDEIAEGWRPFRTWAAVLVRAAAGRASGAQASRRP